MWEICLKMSTSAYVPCHCSTHVACSRNIFTLVIGNYSHSLLDWPKPPSSSLARLLMNWYSTQAHLSLKRQMDMVPWIDIIDVLSWIRFQYLVVWTDQMTKESRSFSKKHWAQTRSYLKKQTDVSLCKLKCSYTLKSSLPMLIPIGYKQQRKWVHFSLSGGWWGGEHSVLSFKYTRRVWK